MLLSSVDKCVSTLADDEYYGLTTLMFSSIGLGVAVSLPELKALAKCSLLALQALDLDVDVSAMVSFDFVLVTFEYISLIMHVFICISNVIS